LTELLVVVEMCEQSEEWMLIEDTHIICFIFVENITEIYLQ